ncbi:hypothetical protein [Deinococcus sp. Leaf326]|uniref:hypothetical protein n=1 Tax=Deinococcus sp. Leaf326 TaxID=1736338 RepID=UPI0006F8D586|nr:hypothetical protein [Deinococcus sp. Leaf326]KQR27879.1 hypothetical protein ASF71_04605 [Deinococcus sp. Leaf326]
MKRLFAVLLALLAGCGSLDASPTTGQLLDAPTSLNVTGQVVRAKAAPVISGSLFNVQVRVQTPRALSGGLRVTDVYVVTSSGVWSAGVGAADQRRCGAGCTVAVGRGVADGVAAGEGVQVVARLVDSQGRSFLLRDDQVRVK